MESAPSLDIARTSDATGTIDSAEAPSGAAVDAGAKVATTIDGQDAPASCSRGAMMADPTAAPAALDAPIAVPSAKDASGYGAASEPSAAGVDADKSGAGAAPGLPPALQPAGSEEVAVELLDSIVGGELGKLDPVSPDTVPPQVSSCGPLSMTQDRASLFWLQALSPSSAQRCVQVRQWWHYGASSLVADVPPTVLRLKQVGEPYGDVMFCAGHPAGSGRADAAGRGGAPPSRRHAGRRRSCQGGSHAGRDRCRIMLR